MAINRLQPHLSNPDGHGPRQALSFGKTFGRTHPLSIADRDPAALVAARAPRWAAALRKAAEAAANLLPTAWQEAYALITAAIRFPNGIFTAVACLLLSNRSSHMPDILYLSPEQYEKQHGLPRVKDSA